MRGASFVRWRCSLMRSRADFEHASVPSGTLKSTLTNRLGFLMPTFVTRRTALGVATAAALASLTACASDIRPLEDPSID